MTNKQRAAARRAFSAFPAVVPQISGDAITPFKPKGRQYGAPVVVTAQMSEAEVENLIRQSCAALNG